MKLSNLTATSLSRLSTGRMLSRSSVSGGNCIKIGLLGKSILRDYFQENRTSRRPFLLLRISFLGRPILYNSSQDGWVKSDTVRHSWANGPTGDVILKKPWRRILMYLKLINLNFTTFFLHFLKKSTFRFDKVKCQVKTKTKTKQTRQKLGAQFQEKYFLNL